MFLHDWDNPILVNIHSSTQDLKGIVKPISSNYAYEKLAIYSFTVTEDVMASVIESTHTFRGGSSMNGGISSDSSSAPYFKKLHKGTTYITNRIISESTTHYYFYTIYPNVK